MLKYLYIFLGSISLGLGVLGIFTPGLPATPFILLTGYLYARSSPRLYNKIENHKLIGSYLKRMKNGVSLKYKIFSIVFMWTMVCFTTFVVFQGKIKLQYLMIGLGIAGTISQLLFLRKKKVLPESNNNSDK